MDEAKEEADEGYQQLLEQKNSILGFSTHVGNINTSLALADRYLRIMQNRDKRHRCYVTLMVLGMFTVIIGSAIGFFS